MKKIGFITSRKIPAQNEFRIHHEYGGTHHAWPAHKSVLDYSQKIINGIAAKLLYARVDLVETAKGPILIELELTDPSLFLSMDNLAPKKFAEVIAHELKGIK